MAVIFKEYTSIIEIQFDFENVLKIDTITEFLFMFSKMSISTQYFKPIGFIYRGTDEKPVKCDLNRVYEILHFIPVIPNNDVYVKRSLVDHNIKEYGMLSYNKSNYSLTIAPRENKKTYVELEQAYNDFFTRHSNLDELNIPETVSNTSSDHSSKAQTQEPIKIDSAALVQCSPSKSRNFVDAGIEPVVDELDDCYCELYKLFPGTIKLRHLVKVVMNDNIVIYISPNKTSCVQYSNMLSSNEVVKKKMKYLIHYNKNTLLESFGNFYIYKGEQCYPVEESLAMVSQCDVCKQFYIRNYMREFYNVCPNCTNPAPSNSTSSKSSSGN